VSSPDVQGLFVWWVGDDVTKLWRVTSRYQLSAEEAQLLYGVRGRMGQSKKATVIKVRRKRLIRTAAYRRRHEMILRILEQRTGQSLLPCHPRVVWGPVLPQDRGRMVREEQILVEAGLHSQRRAMEELGVEDTEAEFQTWLEEERVKRQLGE
jgi:hypothetical protein